MRICNSCGLEKNESDFYNEKIKRCKSCIRMKSNEAVWNRKKTGKPYNPIQLEVNKLRSSNYSYNKSIDIRLKKIKKIQEEIISIENTISRNKSSIEKLTMYRKKSYHKKYNSDRRKLQELSK